jgi:ATP-dependent protease HslVU (ClpYQ) peptidase subunit
MTTILATKYNDIFYIASDSRLTESFTIFNGKSKIHKIADDFYVGYAGSIGVVSGIISNPKILPKLDSNSGIADHKRVITFAESMRPYITDDTTLIAITRFSIYCIDYLKRQDKT